MGYASSPTKEAVQIKVSVYQTVEVSDEQRKEISKLLGVKQVSRDQLKDFLWRHGENWPAALVSSTVSVSASDGELDSLI